MQDLIHALGPDSFVTLVFFQPLPAFIGKISTQKGGNMLGLNSQEHNAILWTGGVAVKTDQQALAFAQTRLLAMVAELKSFSASLGDGSKLVYMNYADPSQDAIGSYGKKSVDLIRRVATEYDPTAAFQTRVPGGFKISRVDV